MKGVVPLAETRDSSRDYAAIFYFSSATNETEKTKMRGVRFEILKKIYHTGGSTVIFMSSWLADEDPPVLLPSNRPL